MTIAESEIQKATKIRDTGKCDYNCLECPIKILCETCLDQDNDMTKSYLADNWLRGKTHHDKSL